jgi:hypothetical protein
MSWVLMETPSSAICLSTNKNAIFIQQYENNLTVNWL